MQDKLKDLEAEYSRIIAELDSYIRGLKDVMDKILLIRNINRVEIAAGEEDAD